MTGDKRYQVFISSTYTDLQSERGEVLRTVMELGCIPAGMELFPAADDEQWAFIRRVIDDCDYYLLLIGARYGSLTKEGISYTEAEFEYAVQSGIPVLAFLHESPEVLRTDTGAEDDGAFEKLLAFRERVAQDRLVKYWGDGAELPGLIALSLTKAFKSHPATGWIRASEAASVDILNDLNDLRKERDTLAEHVRELEGQRTPDLADLAGLEDSTTLHGTYKSSFQGPTNPWEVTMSFGEIFAALAPYLMDHLNETSVKTRVKQIALAAGKKSGYSTTLDDQDFQTAKLQLIALKVVRTRYSKTTKGGMATFWALTAQGERLMYEIRVVRKTE